MSNFLILAFLFFVGSITGWIIELFYRRFFTMSKRWVNPGMCKGPYLPIYGTGLCILYLIASLETKFTIFNPFFNKLILFIFMSFCMTFIEYIAGICLLKSMNLRLWDYSDEWMNIQGVICPRFSLYWAIMGAIYYFFIHPYVLDALIWLSNNLAFSFVIGLFFGFFIIDFIQSSQILIRLKKYAIDNEIIIKYENLKNHIIELQMINKRKYHFFKPIDKDMLIEGLNELKKEFEQLKEKI